MAASEYSLSLWKALERTLSKGRLAYYIDLVEQQTGGNSDEDDKRQKAFELLRWNTQLSESLYLPLQIFEITLRNTMDARITQQYGTAWYRAQQFKRWCAPEALRDIAKALRDFKKTAPLKSSTDHNHFIAATTFGFWMSFLGPAYQRLWEQVLKDGFWPGADRQQLYKLTRHANDIRNRMSHYEPVIVKRFARDLELDQLHEEILRFIGGVCKETGNWVGENSHRRFDVAWQDKPDWWPVA